MSTLLYIKASPMGGLSYSIAAADAFIESYKKSHPADKVNIIDLFRMDMPAFDFAAASAKYKIIHGQPHSRQDLEVWGRIVSAAEEFAAADKYVFAVPMWNFSIPYRLKQYIDIIVQPGLTFTVGANGYEGLVKGKPAFVIYASGGEYPEGSPAEAFDQQKKYLRQILGFMGFTDISSIVVAGTLAGGAEAVRKRADEAIAKARQMAGEF